jgi:hypothetical protein
MNLRHVQSFAAADVASCAAAMEIITSLDYLLEETSDRFLLSPHC